MSAGWIAGAAAAWFAVCFAAGYAVRRFCRNPGQRVDRLADPEPTPGEIHREDDPRWRDQGDESGPPPPSLRHMRPPPQGWPPQTEWPPE